MAETEVGRLLIAVGAELGRSAEQMDPIIKKVVEEEWYDSRESLRNLTEDQWNKLGLPTRLVEKLRAALTDSGPGIPALVPIQPPVQPSMSVDANVEAAPTESDMGSVPVSALLESLIAEIEPVALHADDGDTYLRECLKTLSVIARNVLSDPHNLKFRQLRASNPKFQQHVGRWHSAVAILALLGFQLEIDVYQCSTVYMSRFTDVSGAILARLRIVAPDLALSTPPTTHTVFNPFKASFTNAGDTFGIPQGPLMEERDADLGRLRLEAKPNQVPPRGIPLEKPRVVSLGSAQSNPRQIQDDAEDDTSLLLSSLRSIAAAGDSAQKFRSRERSELEKLRARPVYTTCKVRVCFADKKALELVVGASESVQNLYVMVADCLKSDVKKSTSWLLSISPPMRKLERASKRSLLDEEFVPSVSVRMTLNGNQCNSYDVLVPDLIV